MKILHLESALNFKRKIPLPRSTQALPGLEGRVLTTGWRTSFHLLCLQILASIELTVCDSKLVSFFKVDLQNREAIANCLRSQIKEQIVWTQKKQTNNHI